MPAITILCPLKGHVRFAEESLRSLQLQTFTDFECVVIIAKGSENLSSGIERLLSKDTRFRLLHGLGRGLAADLNHGISQSDSQFVFRQDADDLSQRDRLKKQLEKLQMGFEIVGANAIYLSQFGTASSDLPQTPDSIAIYSAYRNPLIHTSVGAKREALNYYDEAFEGIEDYELWVRAIENRKKIVNLSEKLVSYRMHPGQLSKKRNPTEIRTLRLQVSERVSRFHQYPQSITLTFKKLCVEEVITYSEAEELIGFLTKNREIRDLERYRLIKEIIFGLERLTPSQASRLIGSMQVLIPHFSKLVQLYFSAIFSPGPRSKLNRVLRWIGGEF